MQELFDHPCNCWYPFFKQNRMSRKEHSNPISLYWLVNSVYQQVFPTKSVAHHPLFLSREVRFINLLCHNQFITFMFFFSNWGLPKFVGWSFSSLFFLLQWQWRQPFIHFQIDLKYVEKNIGKEWSGKYRSISPSQSSHIHSKQA